VVTRAALGRALGQEERGDIATGAARVRRADLQLQRASAANEDIFVQAGSAPCDRHLIAREADQSRPAVAARAARSATAASGVKCIREAASERQARM
jgi:hypothetical protein